MRSSATLLAGAALLGPFRLGVVASAQAQAPPAEQPQCASADDAACLATANAASPPPPHQCGLYLAPSTLPHAGLGVYAGTPLEIDTPLASHGEPPLPILDPYKTRPFRGQQRFPSYLAYVWPSVPGALSDLDTAQYPAIDHQLHDFDEGLDRADGIEVYVEDVGRDDWEGLGDLRTLVDDEEEEEEEGYARINAFVPGVASLMNSHSVLYNVDRIYPDDDDEGEGEEKGSEAWRGIEFEAIRPVREGMELLLDYGAEWNERNDAKLDFIELRNGKKRKENKTSDVRHKPGFVEGIDAKWVRLDQREQFQCPEELPTERAKRERAAVGFAADSSGTKENGERPFSQYRTNDRHPWEAWDDEDKRSYGADDDDDVAWENDPSLPGHITRSVPWLNDHGVCLATGKLGVGPSRMSHAGRGVLATASIRAGEAILPSPLLAMRHEDFVIYQSHPEEEHVRKILDKTTVLGMELMYNRAFAHPESPLYLVPSAPMAGYINHGGREGANVRVRWPEEGTNAAKLFEWAYTQTRGSHYSHDFDPTAAFDNPNPWLKDHPIDVMERSGKMALEYVAVRDIAEGEEILIDYGDVWETAWTTHLSEGKNSPFRQPIGVPDGFFPNNWLGVGDRYEVAEIKGCGEGSPECSPPEPGAAVPMTWAHNGKPVGSKYAYAVGLPKGFSERFLEYSEKIGMIELYRKLLTEQEGYHIASDGFKLYGLVNGTTSDEAIKDSLEFFAHRYATATWNLKFNMHFVAAWNEAARRSVMSALGDAGFDFALRGIGERFGYDNMTCFHASYMGITHCEKSIMHSDIYATNDKSWNLVFPLVTVDGTEPELDVLAEDMNTVVGVHYLKDVAYAMGDFGYHQTVPMAYYDPEQERKAPHEAPIRVVFGTYCSQIDETNVAMIRHIYDGDDPAPFIDQFEEMPLREVHWESGKAASLANPAGKGR